MNALTKKFSLFILIILFFCLSAELALAQTATPTPTPVSISGGVKSFGQKVYGQSPQSPQVIVALIINVVLGLLGILFVGLIVYGGYTYMISQGSQDQIKKAKGILTTAVIGLIIVLISYAIADFVISRLAAVFGQGGLGTPGGGG